MAQSLQQSSLNHQSNSTFPRLDSAVVDSSGELSKTWYYFLLKIWQLLGGNAAPSLQEGVFLSSSDGESNATVLSSNSGKVILGGDVQETVPADSPYTFTAPSSGTLVLSNNISFTISRNKGVPVSVAASGGAIFLQQGDVVVGTWSAGNAYFNFFPFIFK